MDERYRIRLLPWRQKNKANSKSAQIKFAPKLRMTHKDGWAYLELQLVNRSSWGVWVEEATIVLIDLDAESQTAISTGEGKLAILQNIGLKDELSVSLAGAIFDAAGRPQGPYSSLSLRMCSKASWMSGAMLSLTHTLSDRLKIKYSLLPILYELSLRLPFPRGAGVRSSTSRIFTPMLR
jgi:hypothetical protein